MSTTCWKWLEKRSSRTAVMAQWKSVTEEWFPAIRPLLGPLDRRATTYPNPRGEPMRVVVHADGQVVAIDESDWEHRVVLDPHDIVLHRLDLRRLRTALCNALDSLRIAKTPVDQNTTCLRVGNWEPKKAASFSSISAAMPEHQHAATTGCAVDYQTRRRNSSDSQSQELGRCLGVFAQS